MPKSITDKRIFYKLNKAQRLLLKYVNRDYANKLGVPVAQIAALFYLINNTGCLLRDLTDTLPQNKSATTTLVERMAKNGLIEMKKSATDGRATQIFITDKGRDICQKARPILAEHNRDLLEPFSDADIDVIHRFLDTIIDRYR